MIKKFELNFDSDDTIQYITLTTLPSEKYIPGFLRVKIPDWYNTVLCQFILMDNSQFSINLQENQSYILDCNIVISNATICKCILSGVPGGSGGIIEVEISTEEELVIENYTLRMNIVGSVTYIGKALIGSSTNDDVWQIQKIDETSGLSITWANGNDYFDNIWDNYLILSYL